MTIVSTAFQCQENEEEEEGSALAK